ncbi:MAG: UvrD-helicase domain-containing protein, partial [Oscillospiraceae bacterium]|nr:UvrD-helicase domain-containing protein [Oscillospiraceae bacterium]
MNHYYDQAQEWKKKALRRVYGRMNDRQLEAVFQVKGPVLILAGAGSGKTTVLVNRISNLLRFGNAYHAEGFPGELAGEDAAFLKDFAEGRADDVARLAKITAVERPQPWNVLAITFTNKAAGELKERLGKALGPEANDIMAATFHSACVRILRREIDRLGYSKSFTIYDSDDSQRVVKDALKSMNLDDKTYPPKMVLGLISRAKDSMQTPADFAREAGTDFRLSTVARIYEKYQASLKKADALDFDDIIVLTVRLLSEYPEVLEYYQRRYRYIMVDEYQDTNAAQYRLVSLLSGGHQNLCVVGDDDQSIYKFRGATIE